MSTVFMLLWVVASVLLLGGLIYLVAKKKISLLLFSILFVFVLIASGGFFKLAEIGCQLG